MNMKPSPDAAARLLTIARVRSGCYELGPEVGEFISECLKMEIPLDMMKQALLKQNDGASAQVVARTMSMLEEVLMFDAMNKFTRCRYLLDKGMVPNELRKAKMVFLLMGLVGMTYEMAEQYLEDHGKANCEGPDCFLELLLAPEPNA